MQKRIFEIYFAIFLLILYRSDNFQPWKGAQKKGDIFQDVSQNVTPDTFPQLGAIMIFFFQKISLQDILIDVAKGTVLCVLPKQLLIIQGYGEAL